MFLVFHAGLRGLPFEPLLPPGREGTAMPIHHVVFRIRQPYFDEIVAGCGYVSENELDLGVHYRADAPRVFAMKGPGKKGKEPPQNDPKPGPLLEDEDHEEENWG